MSREIHSFSPEVEKGAENQVAAVGSIQAEEDAREAERVLARLKARGYETHNVGGEEQIISPVEPRQTKKQKKL